MLNALNGTGNSVHINMALAQIALFMERLCPDEGQRRVWGNGPAFDNEKLRQLFIDCDLPVPWRFYNDRCFRTIKGMFSASLLHIKQSEETKHHACYDATNEALNLLRYVSALKDKGVTVG